MSFRYTNSLIGAMKHRILLEKSRRLILSREFTGRCNGVVVKYSPHGTVLSITVAKEDEARFVDSEAKVVNTELLCSSIRTAVHQANRELVTAKEEAYRRSITNNDQLKAENNFRLWFESDASSLAPFAFEAITNEVGRTAWGTQVRHDSVDSPLTIADTHSVHKPALLSLEDRKRALTEQRKEMAEDERAFWNKVELIRKGQTATVKDSEKRGYKDQNQMGATAQDASGEKVVLKFVQ